MKHWFVFEQIMKKELSTDTTERGPEQSQSQQIAVLVSDTGETLHLPLEVLPPDSQINDVFYQENDTFFQAPEEKRRRQEKAIALRKQLSEPPEQR